MTADPGRVTAPLLDVLEVLLEASGGDVHGWMIMKATGRGGPTVYKILERLTEMGWITARWEEPAEELTRPRRRLYELTGDGAARARELLHARRPHQVQGRAVFRPALGHGQ